MKRVSILVVACLLALSNTALATTIQGAANLHQIDRSGISARISFTDTGSVLRVTGSATGLTPGQHYFSLLYDNGSIPSGPVACEPSSSNDISFQQMLVGFWTVNADGTGTLSRTLPGTLTLPPPFPPSISSAYVPLSRVHTISIRHVEARFTVQACGEIHTLD